MSWQVASKSDKEKTLEFFQKMDSQVNPPFSKLPHGLEGTIDSLYSNGKNLIAKVDQEVVGLLGYFKGIPRLTETNDFVFDSKNIAYVYAFVVNPNNRGRLTFDAIPILGTETLKDNCNEIQFKAYKEDNELINRFYSRFANVISEEINTQGKICNVYSTTPDRLMK